jgi:hypothetical protein
MPLQRPLTTANKKMKNRKRRQPMTAIPTRLGIASLLRVLALQPRLFQYAIRLKVLPLKALPGDPGSSNQMLTLREYNSFTFYR